MFVKKAKKVDFETRQNVDKRTSRKEHKKIFQKVIKHYQNKHPKNNPNVKNMTPKCTTEKFSIFMRKRPIFAHEIRKGEYDTVTTYPTKNKIVVHDARMRANLKIRDAFVENFEFSGFDKVFGEKSTNEEVYENSVMILLQHVLSGYRREGLVFMYGQTGSGKTYTITAIMKKLVSDLFLWKQFMEHLTVFVSCFEMAGDYIYDLLNRRAKLQIRNDSLGKCNVIGLCEKNVNSGEGLLDTLARGMALRHTESTNSNSVSSRSHCFMKIFIRNGNGDLYSALQLIDLAGSERNADSMFHSKDRRKEGAQINSSLMCLKDCLRVYHSNKRTGKNDRIPYRNDKLTRMLKECFTNKKFRVNIFGTCGPCPTDTEHTVSTLKNICLMSRNSKMKSKIYDVNKIVDMSCKLPPHPRLWSVDDVRSWLGSVGGGKFKKYLDNFPSQLDGKQLVRYSEKRFAQICDGKKQAGEAFRDALMAEIRKSDRHKKKENGKKKKTKKKKKNQRGDMVF